MTPECTLDAVLIVIGFCVGRRNVKIHDNYKKAICKFKVIIAPVSALKSPSYRLIRDIIDRLNVVLQSAVTQVFKNKSDREDEEIKSEMSGELSEDSVSDDENADEIPKTDAFWTRGRLRDWNKTFRINSKIAV